MISLILKYYADPVTVVPSKWISPLERLVAFPSGVAGNHLEGQWDELFMNMSSYYHMEVNFCSFSCFILGGVGITCWLVVCNKVVAVGLHAVS